MPGENRYDREHLRNISSYLNRIDEIYRRVTDEVAKAVAASGAEYDPDSPFSFDDYPSARRKVDRAVSELSSQVERTIVNGIKAQWELSNRKNDDLVETVTGLKADDLPDTLKRRYFATNEPARKAFTERAREDMNLSEEVWRFRRETEFGIDLSLKGMQDRMERGLSEGVSAADMSRELRGYLKNPDKLFRRVRDERGNLTLSRNARLFHPGQGVYRSSYMNARRLAATETNMAYRSADHERWKSLDFVVGIEIQTSNNHTTKDSAGKTVELEDICDTLAGRYPKGFKFVGWHPHCRCIATTILKTEEEMQADTERILNGEEPLPPESSANYEGNLPEKFTKWLDKNSERIANAKSLPYFLKDNQKLIEEEGAKKLTALEIAQIRHENRTAREISDIKERWADRAVGLGEDALTTARDYGEVDYSKLEKAIADRNVAEIQRQIKAANLAVEEMRGREEALSDLIPDAHKWHQRFTMEQLQGVHDAVEKKLADWSKLPLEEQRKKLDFEVNEYFAKNKNGVQSKYPTWEVAQSAYGKRLAEVETKIEIEGIKSQLADVSQWSSAHTKSLKVASLLSDAEAAIAKGEDLAEMRRTADLAIAEYQKRLAEQARRDAKKLGSPFTDDAYTEARRNAAVFDKGDGSTADKALWDTASKSWMSATEGQKDSMYQYTKHFSNINEPLRGIKYCNTQTKADFVRDVTNMTKYVDGSSLPCDMWFQRGDVSAAVRSRIAAAGGTMPSDVTGLVGMTLREDGFMSAGSRYKSGLIKGKNVFFNIYAPKGTKAAYIEPFSYYGKGGDRNWDGKTKYSVFGDEQETLFQRGTIMRITKAEYKNGKYYIDCEIIGQDVKDLKYVKDSNIGTNK